MDIDIRFDCSEVDWKGISATLKRVGMGYYKPDLHEKAFENSYAAVFVYHGDQLIGFGRAISDGAYQAAIYDVETIIGDFLARGGG